MNIKIFIAGLLLVVEICFFFHIQNENNFLFSLIEVDEDTVFYLKIESYVSILILVSFLYDEIEKHSEKVGRIF